MPALTSYSPYETLVFFQNVAYYGVDKTSLQNISTTLNQNQLIRESEDYDASKFSPDALHHLYNRTINARQDEVPNGVNGGTNSSHGNPLKRKLSTSPAPSHPNDDHSLQQYVDTLYNKFKDETIKELRRQEEEYQRLQDEIQNLETQVKEEEVKDSQPANVVNNNVGVAEPSTERTDPVSAQLHADLEAANHDVKPSSQPTSSQVSHQPPTLMPQPYEGTQPSPLHDQRASTPKSSSGTPLPRHAQPPTLPSSASHHSPNTFSRTLPPPSPQRNNYGQLPPPPPHGFTNQPQNQPPPPMLPPIHGLQRMPSHDGYPPRAPSQGRGSPMPQHPPPGYPQYPPYQQWHSPGPQQYPPPPYPPQQHYAPHIPGRYPQVHTPNQPTYQPYPHTAPIPYPNQQSQQHRRGPPIPQYHQYPASSSNTPISRPDSRTAIFRSGGSTPWKKRSQPSGFRPRSPSRLEREVSPISDTGSPPPETSESRSEKPVKRESTTQNSLSREKSTTPAAIQSRSQSVLSNVSEVPVPPKRKVGRPPKPKPEPPSTPAPMTSDSEQPQRSTGRRGRPRTNTVTNKTDLQRTTTTTKRKRDAPSESPAPRSLSISQAAPTSVPRPTVQNHDPNLVIVSKTFGRTSQLLLNEITSHKVAGIFAKPLTEREAPGYKSRVLRPQDLKSIKAAISKGSRAAIAAIERLESEDPNGENDSAEKGDDVTIIAIPTPKAVSSSFADGSSTGEGPVGNGFYYVHATEDLLPPKGIVNSAQLEMELVRMFANAIMFNPLPTSERGFGRSLRLRKRGGELPQYGARPAKSEPPEDNDGSEDDGEREESEPATIATSTSETESSAAGADEGGIIANTREMFNDVEKLVARWRDLEGGSTASGWHGSSSIPMTAPAAAGGTVAERHNSVSASSVAGEDYGDGIGTPSASFAGSVRKRRKVGDR